MSQKTVAGALDNEKNKSCVRSAVSLECQMTMKTALAVFSSRQNSYNEAVNDEAILSSSKSLSNEIASNNYTAIIDYVQSHIQSWPWSLVVLKEKIIFDSCP